jgi:thiosulfate dehydrogenase [quinone] large subunit
MGTHSRRTPSSAGLIGDWRSQPIALGVLRAFLGVTFVYAGVQKFADPNFLHAGTPDYIGNQLRAFAIGSPIGPLLRVLAHAPWLTGVGIALLEIAVGIGTLLGVARVAAAIAGFAISLMLFLSATWNVHPYFLGSDSMYAVAWIAYLAGIWEGERRRSRTLPPAPGRSQARESPSDLGRRQVLRGAMVAGATLLLAGIGRAAMGAPGSPAASGSGFTRTSPPPKKPRRSPAHHHGGGTPTHRPTPHHAHHPTEGPTTEPTTGPVSGGGATQGRPIASLDSLPVGGAVPFTGPGGQPCALFRLSQSDVAAFSRICTHAGCVVGYDQSAKLLVCPCHGAEFDPSHGGAPVAGPAPTPLESIHVVIDKGEVVLPA